MPDRVLAPPGGPPAGTQLGGAWTVLGPVETPAPFPVLRLRGEDGAPAIGVLLPEDAEEPLLDETWADHWNVARRVLRDPEWGRILVDELPDGPGIVDEADGIAPPGAVEELARLVHDAHRRGTPHGLLAPALIVRGSAGIAAAGWGLLVDPREEAVSRDLAALAALEGTTGRIAPGGDGEDAPPDAEAILRPALFSGHLPTLAAAVERAREAGVPGDDPLLRRAEDARARLEEKVSAHLAAARERLERGDPLGAVAACREAIRLGAEDEAGPLLAEARRQARRLVGKPRLRWAWVASGGLTLVAVLVLVVLLAGRGGDRAEGDLLRRAAALGEEQGARAAASMLLEAWRERGAPAALEAPIEEWVSRTAREERERLLALRREVVRRGGRPRRADRLADRALDELDRVAAAGLSQPNPDLRLTRALLEVDRAASYYRASAVLTASQAAEAVDHLLRVDPVFAGRSRAEEEAR